MRRRLGLILAGAVPLAIVACQPLPHPFADNRPPPQSPMISPPDAAGIVVGPVVGAPAPAAKALAEAMAAALRQQEVPADTGAANRRSYRLAGRVAVASAAGRTRVDIVWWLASAQGRVIDRENATGEVAEAAWRQGDAALAKRLAAETAPALVRRVEGDVPHEVAVAKPVIAVATVTGAPGDGDPTLTRAMGDVLRRAGFELAARPGDKADFRLAGRVAVGRSQAGKQRVAIVWVLSGAKGGEIGRISQANQVPTGSLDRAWGGTAYDVALAAIGGIVELIDRARLATRS